MNEDQYILWNWHELEDFANSNCRDYLLDHYAFHVEDAAERISQIYNYENPNARRKIRCEDLADEGHKGLIKAVERFDPDGKHKFETLCCIDIRKNIYSHLRHTANWNPKLALWKNKRELKTVLDGMSADEKLIVFLYRFENLWLDEIAETLNLPESAVRQTCQSFTEQLRPLYSKAKLHCFAFNVAYPKYYQVESTGLEDFDYNELSPLEQEFFDDAYDGICEYLEEEYEKETGET